MQLIKKDNNRVFELYSAQNHKETIHLGLQLLLDKNVQLHKFQPINQLVVSRASTGPL